MSLKGILTTLVYRLPENEMSTTMQRQTYDQCGFSFPGPGVAVDLEG
jgi:hypothetical protein